MSNYRSVTKLSNQQNRTRAAAFAHLSTIARVPRPSAAERLANATDYNRTRTGYSKREKRHKLSPHQRRACKKGGFAVSDHIGRFFKFLEEQQASCSNRRPSNCLAKPATQVPIPNCRGRAGTSATLDG